MNFEGEFETHITLALAGGHEFELLWQWSNERDLKCTHILLDRGQSASQPMLTRESVGTLAQTLEQSKQLQRECENAGFRVSRVKLEVPPWNPDVPLSSAQAHSPERYFEHHVKLLIPGNSDLLSLQEAVKQHGARLSRNARRTRTDGNDERFVTQRCYGVGRREAQAAFGALMRTLQVHSFPVLETEQEYVVYDSNIALDAGWMGETTPSS